MNDNAKAISKPTVGRLWSFIGGIVLTVLIMFILIGTGMWDAIMGTDKPPAKGEWGSFSGTPKTEWLDDGRLMKLTEDFAYVDKNGRTWASLKGSTIDGASIPQYFFSVVGGPFDGQYRNASIVHDTACDDRREKWQDVHRMFYEACLCGGLPKRKAQLLYWAVYNGGPQWTFVEEVRTHTIIDDDGTPRTVTETVQAPMNIVRNVKVDEETLKRVEKRLTEKDFTLEELENLEIP
jgi:hypothetical protein